jgi:hypothetical protein
MDAAARSVLTTGNFCLVVPDFFGMHVPRADWPEPSFPTAHPNREGQEDVPPGGGATDS